MLNTGAGERSISEKPRDTRCIYPSWKLKHNVTNSTYNRRGRHRRWIKPETLRCDAYLLLTILRHHSCGLTVSKRGREKGNAEEGCNRAGWSNRVEWAEKMHVWIVLQVIGVKELCLQPKLGILASRRTRPDEPTEPDGFAIGV